MRLYRPSVRLFRKSPSYSTVANLFLFDVFALWQISCEFWTTLRPTISSRKTRLLGLSTTGQ